MPNRSLSYKIEMDTRTAVRDLQRLTREGRKAGEDIADGFDSTETAGTNALRALSRQLDQLEQDAKGTAQAAEAIGRQMSDGYDQSRINGFVADLNRIGVGFDEIEQKAEEFAAVLKRADDTELSSVRGELDQVGEGLDRTRDSGDQSRSVLANLAGNASQDLGELGGVVGSLGVGIGQLAEYAVDGNIALSNLAKVAGPMALLSGGLALVNVAMGRMSKAREADAEAAADWQAAIEESGAGVEGVLQRLTKARQLFTEPSGDVFGFEQWLFGEDPIDVIGAMQTIGLSADQLAEILVDLRDSGQEFSRDTFLATPQLQQLASSLLEVGYSGTEASDIFGVIWEEFERFSRGSKEASVNAEFFADSLAGINQAMVTNQESASNLNDLWSKVLDDLADNGVIDDSAGAWNRLRDVLDLSRDGLAELAQQKLDEKLQADADAADELAAATRDMAVAFADARRQIDDILAETPDLAGALAGELDKVDSVLEGLKFDESFDARFQEALDGLRGFEPDLQTLADNWQDVLNGVEIDLLGNVRTDDAEALAAIESLTNIVQEGVVDAFGDGGTDSAQAFLDNLISQISSATGIDPSVLYQLVGAGPDGSVDALIRPAIDADAAAKAAAILDVLAGVSDDPRIAQIQLQLLTGELTPEQALAATMAAYQEWLDANPATVPIEGDSEGAESEARGFRRAAGRDPAVVPIDGDGKQARDELSSIEDGDYQATINANLLQQVIAGKFISEFLDWAARPRTVQIGVEVTGLQAANQLLDNVARDRTSTIVVDANTWALSRDIATAISNAVRLGRIAS